MAYGIITMRKISGTLYGIQSHIYREHDSKTNPDIDKNRSQDNYSLLYTELGQNVENLVKSRLEELPPKKTNNGKRKTIRKNAVKLCDFVITASPEALQSLNETDRDQYFYECVQWLEARYGKENIVYSQVHLDEANPHLHVGVVPIKDNELNAKALFDKKEMKSIQDDFFRDIGRPWGLQRPPGGVKGLETLRYKVRQARKELVKLKGVYECAPERVQGYIRDAIRSCIENDLKEKNDLSKDALATFRYIRDFGDESWKNDFEYLTEMEKSDRKNKAAYRDEY